MKSVNSLELKQFTQNLSILKKYNPKNFKKDKFSKEF